MSAITLARLAAEARSLPARNPLHATDALLVYADALTEAAVALAASDRAETAPPLRDLADSARALASIFAPPSGPAIGADAATHILRRE
jgi:hypothetical protein